MTYDTSLLLALQVFYTFCQVDIYKYLMPVAKRSKKTSKSTRTRKTRSLKKRSVKKLKTGGNQSDINLNKIAQLASSLTSGTDMLFVQYPLSSLRNKVEYQAPAIDFASSLKPANSAMVGKSIDQVGSVQSVQEVVDIPPNSFTVLITSIPQLAGQPKDVWRAYVKTSFQDDAFEEFEIQPGQQVIPTGITARYQPTSPKQVMTN